MLYESSWLLYKSSNFGFCPQDARQPKAVLVRKLFWSISSHFVALLKGAPQPKRFVNNESRRHSKYDTYEFVRVLVRALYYNKTIYA